MWDKKDKKVQGVKPLEEIPVTPEVPRFINPDRVETVKIGKSIFIKGEVSGGQDLIIEGNIEGEIQLKENQVTIGENGKMSGEIYAKSIIIQGQVVGNMFAGEKLEIKSTGSLKGDISSPRLVIDDGAYFKGIVNMEAGTQQRFERSAIEILEVVKSDN